MMHSHTLQVGFRMARYDSPFDVLSYSGHKLIFALEASFADLVVGGHDCLEVTVTIRFLNHPLIEELDNWAAGRTVAAHGFQLILTTLEASRIPHAGPSGNEFRHDPCHFFLGNTIIQARHCYLGSGGTNKNEALPKCLTVINKVGKRVTAHHHLGGNADTKRLHPHAATLNLSITRNLLEEGRYLFLLAEIHFGFFVNANETRRGELTGPIVITVDAIQIWRDHMLLPTRDGGEEFLQCGFTTIGFAHHQQKGFLGGLRIEHIAHEL